MALLVLTISASSFFLSTTHASSDSFLRCLSATIPSKLLFPQGSPLFSSVLSSSVRNPLFLTPATVKPVGIVTATNASHVQAAVVCGRTHGVRLRVRSGGHDYEGLSYRSTRADNAAPFAVVDLFGLRSVRVTRGSPATAWVDSGAQLGELYYAIGKVSNQLAFPGGLCPTVGVGGHFTGGGFGMLLRRFGLAADQVVDALIVNAEGRILDSNAMGRDVFWAIRGGGGGSFGIVLSWKVNLVAVPPKVATFAVIKKVNQGAADLVARWQEVAPALPNELLVRVLAQGDEAKFESLYLGTCDALLQVMRNRFPELGVDGSHCKEMSWLQSVAHVYLGPGTAVEDLLQRSLPGDRTFSKATSDYVRQAISRNTWAEIFRNWIGRPNAGLMILEPYGGKIAQVSESQTPFPHRQGVLYNIQYMNFWGNPGEEAAKIGWIRDVHAFMTPHVTKNPREAYANYRDLDLGQNVVVGDITSFEAGRVWGEKYYKGNFRRLAMAKAQIDPTDFFRSEQSIPPLRNNLQLISMDVERVEHTDE